MGYILVVIAFAVLIKEVAQLYAELQRSVAIDKAKADDWARWHWQPTPEQQAKLDAACEESKRVIAENNRRYWKKWQEEHQEV